MIIMLAAENLLKILEDSNNEMKYPSNDYNFGKVMEFCNNDNVSECKLKCSDGQEREFSF